jgi:hypothetical protein
MSLNCVELRFLKYIKSLLIVVVVQKNINIKGYRQGLNFVFTRFHVEFFVFLCKCYNLICLQLKTFVPFLQQGFHLHSVAMTQSTHVGDGHVFTISHFLLYFNRAKFLQQSSLITNPPNLS